MCVNVKFPTLPQEFLWQLLLANLTVGTKTDPAFGVPYGNGLQFI